MKLKNVLLGLAVLLLMTFAFGCKDAPTESGTNNAAIEELIVQAGELPDPETHPLIEETFDYQEQRGDELWLCKKTKIDAAEAPDKFPFFDPIAEVIWPGAALQGRSITSPTPERIIAKRSSGTVLINNITGASVSSVNVDEVTQSKVLNAANEIIRNQPTAFPADLFISITEVRSNDELAWKLKANSSFFGLFKASSKFEISKRDEVKSFFVSLNQSFYTLIFERPPKISDFFHKDVTPKDLEPFVGKNNPPVYVSSVTYGRVFYLLIESVEEADTIKASLGASFIFGGFKGNVKHVSQLKSLSVQAFALGGDANEALNSVIGGIQNLDSFIESLRKGGVISTGKPLSYSIRSVRSDKLVSNSVATKFEVTDCTSSGFPGVLVTNRLQHTQIPRIATFKIDGVGYKLEEAKSICVKRIKMNPDTLWLQVVGGFGAIGLKPILVNSGRGYEVRSIIAAENNLFDVGSATGCN